MAAGLATVSASVLHRTQLCHTPLGALVHGHVCHNHPLDCFLLLHHGVDGKMILDFLFACFSFDNHLWMLSGLLLLSLITGHSDWLHYGHP